VVNLGTEFFDGAVYSINGNAGATYQHNQRWSFGMSGGSFVTRRHSNALASAQGYGANGEINRVLNRRSTVGVSYQYGNFFFPKGFGRSDIHTWMGQYSRQLTRRWTFSGGAGLYRAESQRLQNVQVDPVVAALIGVFSSVQVFHNVVQGLSASAGIGGRLGSSSVGIAYHRGISPGNGVFLTSQEEVVQGNVSFLSRRRVNAGTYAMWGRLKQVFEGLDGNAGRMSASRACRRVVLDPLHLWRRRRRGVPAV